MIIHAEEHKNTKFPVIRKRADFGNAYGFCLSSLAHSIYWPSERVSNRLHSILATLYTLFLQNFNIAFSYCVCAYNRHHCVVVSQTVSFNGTPHVFCHYLRVRSPGCGCTWRTCLWALAYPFHNLPALIKILADMQTFLCLLSAFFRGSLSKTFPGGPLCA